MAEITLSGKVIKIDVTKLTVKQYRAFTSALGNADFENDIISTCTGIAVDEIENMNFSDSRVLIKAILRTANQPLLDPN
jgi:hypothetical protein